LTDYIEFSRLTQKFFTGQIEALLVEAGASSITVEGADQQVCMDDDHGASGEIWLKVVRGVEGG